MAEAERWIDSVGPSSQEPSVTARATVTTQDGTVVIEGQVVVRKDL